MPAACLATIENDTTASPLTHQSEWITATMSDDHTCRLGIELHLLDAMFPEQTYYNIRSREFKFTADEHASLVLRLPENYPERGLPDIISATNAAKTDVRAQTRVAVQELSLLPGEEALDAIVAAFHQVLEHTKSTPHRTALSHPGHSEEAPIHSSSMSSKPKTVIIWLHHLLNTNKRKLALSPTNLSGLSKPGYPGVLIYSGPSQSIADHVATLKAQNWQAFNVRYEIEEGWLYAHGEGVREVETMAEVVKSIETNGGGKVNDRGMKQKEAFLKAVGIK